MFNLNGVTRGVFDKFIKDNPDLKEVYPYFSAHTTGYLDHEGRLQAAETSSSYTGKYEYAINAPEYGDNLNTIDVFRSICLKKQP